MTTTELKERAAEMKEMTGDYMRDEITFTKLDFCLLGAVLFLAGICIGLLTAPFTHGISIGSHNGCNNGNNNGHNENSSVGARAE